MNSPYRVSDSINEPIDRNDEKEYYYADHTIRNVKVEFSFLSHDGKIETETEWFYDSVPPDYDISTTLLSINDGIFYFENFLKASAEKSFVRIKDRYIPYSRFVEAKIIETQTKNVVVKLRSYY